MACARTGTVFSLAAVLTLCLAWPSSAARGDTAFPNVGLEGTCGSGVNEALLVVDFWPGNGQADSFAFSVRFGSVPEDAMTGFDLLNAVKSGTNGAFDFECDDFGWGLFVDGISYTVGATRFETRSWPTGFVSYWNADAPSLQWTDAPVGISDRQIHHGAADGYLPVDWNLPWGTWPEPVLPKPFSAWKGSGAVPASWGDATEWTAAVPQNAGDAARLGEVIGQGQAVLRLDGDRTLAELRLQTTQGSYAIEPGSGGSLILDNGGQGATLAVLAGEHQIAAPLVLADTLFLAAAGQSKLTLSGPVTAAGNDIVKDGTGTVVLTAALTDHGSLTLAEGSMELAALEGNGATTVAAGATLTAGYIRQSSLTIGGTAGGAAMGLGAAGAAAVPATPVPEPGSLALILAACAAGLAVRLRRFRAGPGRSGNGAQS